MLTPPNSAVSTSFNARTNANQLSISTGTRRITQIFPDRARKEDQIFPKQTLDGQIFPSLNLRFSYSANGQREKEEKAGQYPLKAEQCPIIGWIDPSTGQRYGIQAERVSGDPIISMQNRD